MTSSLYAEKLSWFKENEKAEAALLLADDPQMVKIAVAWTTMSVRQAEEASPLAGGSEGEAWEWLWRNASYSRAELAAKSTLPELILGKKLPALIGNRVLYPDGTINSFAQRYLREMVLKLFETGQKRAVGRRAVKNS